MQYRDAGGKQRWYQVCDAATVAPKDIAEAVAIVRGRLAKGGDPAGERKAEAKRARARLEPALDAYEADLERRHVVQRKHGHVAACAGSCRARSATSTRRPDPQRSGRADRRGRGERRPGAAQDLRKMPPCSSAGAPIPGGSPRARSPAGGGSARPGRSVSSVPGGRSPIGRCPILWKAADDAEGWHLRAYL